MSITINEITKQDISRILSHQVDEQDIDEILEVDESENLETSDIDDDFDCIRLRELTQQELQNIKVTVNSKFSDTIWDLSDQSNAVTKGVSVLVFDEAKSPLIAEMLKHWCFYRLPLTTGNRVQTAYYQLRHMLIVANTLHEMGFFNESEYLATHRALDSFTLEDRDELFRRLKESSLPAGQLYKIGFIMEALCYDWMIPGFLPPEYSFPIDIFKDYPRKEAFPEPDLKQWEPINPETLYPVAQAAIEILDNVAPDMIYLYSEYCLAEIEAVNKIAVSEAHSYQASYIKMKTISNRLDPILDGFVFADLFGEPWFEVKVNTGWLARTNRHSKYGKRFIKYHGNFLVRSACEILISLTMGLRSSELRGLKVGCCRPKEGKAGEYEIDVTIYKTAQSKDGELVTLPCPELTYRAVQTMEKLMAHRRKEYGIDYLFVVPKRVNVGKKTGPMSNGVVHHDLVNFAEYFGVDTFHHHQFRKTIANFFVHQDPRNIDLVKKLFSHSSISMSLKYIVHIPTIAREIHSLLVKENIDVFTDLLISASKGTVSGRQRDHLIASTTGENPLFKGETEEELGRNILSYIETIMRSGTTLMRRAPLNLCIGEASPTQKCHCRKENEPAELQNLPNVSNCQPYGCSGSIFTERNEAEIRIEIEFFEYLQSNPASSELIKKDAQMKLAKLYKILEEITLPLEGATA